MAGLLSAFQDPEQMGLLAAAAQMLQASGPSRTPTSFGQVVGGGLLAGMQGMQQAEENAYMRDYRKSQAEQLKTKAAATKAQQDALSRVSQGYQLDPNFKPSMGDLLAIDPDSAIKGMMPGGAVDFGLEPKVGINPETGKHGYFIQDKRGNTKWLGADVPENYKYVPGTDYKPDQRFNPRTGETTPLQPGLAPTRSTPGGAPSMMSTGGSASMMAAPTAQEVDPLAPWGNIVSPKEQDQMRGRVYDQSTKALQDLRAAVGQGRANMRDLERFGELNRKTATGSLLDKYGFIPTTNEDKREMEAIVARLAPAQRVEGSGTTSDRDISLYLQGLPGIDKPGNVNKAIRDQFAGQLNAKEKELSFKDAYLTERGHLTGADEARAQAAENIKTGGLDVSKLTAEQVAFLKQQDPDAFDRGVARLQKNGGGSAPAADKTLLAQLPTANRSNQGKVAIDHETGKKYKSNGLQWVEVQ